MTGKPESNGGISGIRQHSADEYLRIKALFRRLVKRCGGLESAATITRVGSTQLHSYQSANHMEAYPPADVVYDLEADCGEALLSRELVRMTNHCAPAAGAEHDPHAMLASMVKELGEFAGAVTDAAANGGTSDADLLRMICECGDVVMASQAAHDRLCREQTIRRENGKPREVGAAE